jgi:hypothetical protein
MRASVSAPTGEVAPGSPAEGGAGGVGVCLRGLADQTDAWLRLRLASRAGGQPGLAEVAAAAAELGEAELVAAVGMVIELAGAAPESWLRALLAAATAPPLNERAAVVAALGLGEVGTEASLLALQAMGRSNLPQAVVGAVQWAWHAIRARTDARAVSGRLAVYRAVVGGELSLEESEDREVARSRERKRAR